jgi:hypothetical protein
LINELVKTGKFTEDEAKELITKSMQSGADTAPATDTAPVTDTVPATDTAPVTDTVPTADTTTNSNTNTSANETPSSNNEDDNNINNNQSSSTNTNNPENYDDLNELVDDIKNRVVESNDISLNAFKDSGAYQGADQETQDCIDLAGKIGDNLTDREIVHCSEDTNYFQNQISNNNNNNADQNTNNANDNNNNADDTSN